jgi:hypothetical protein
MIHVDFDPSKLTGAQKTWWGQWQEKAAEATQGVIQAWESSKKLSSKDFKDDIWRELKEWLLENVFHGKCAYCETHIHMSRQSGHAEHFRPKGGVNYEEHGKKRLKKATVEDEGGQSIEHPGYFWLAYHWKNLLPSCEFCNSGGGKKNQFPVQQRHVLVRHLTQEKANQLNEKPYESSKLQDVYYLQPDDLDELEHPLLLHPYIDDPREHLCFGHAGIEAPRENENGELSVKGAHSIEVYDLKNEQLRRARQNAQSKALTNFLLAYMNALRQGYSPGTCLQKAWEEVTDIAKGKTPYSAAALDCINLHCQTLGRSLFSTATASSSASTPTLLS